MQEMRGIFSKRLIMKNDKRGFTLAELLVVVAIIAVLVAVSIPIFTGQLDKAAKAADDANVRAAKACVATDILSSEKTSGYYFYDAKNGVALDMQKSTTGIANGSIIIQGYSQCDHKNGFLVNAGEGIICMTYNNAGKKEITAFWRSWGQVKTMAASLPTP